MSEYDNEMTGVLFKNKKKTTERHPAYKGSCEINGVEMWISAWINEKKDETRDKYMSLKFELKEGFSFQSTAAAGDRDVPIDTRDFAPPAAGNLMADDDIPF